MTEAVEIRPVVQSDFDAWLPLWNGYNSFYGRSGPAALDPGITRVTWNRFLDDREPMHALVAQSNHTLIGLAHYILHRSTTMTGLTCYLSDLFTVEAARGRGVGRALIDAVSERAASAGCGRVYWQTHETNLTAMKLYDRVAARSGFLVYRKTL